MKEIRSLKLKYCDVSFRSDEIIEQRFSMNTPYVIDAKEITELSTSTNILAGDQPRAILSISGLYGSMTPEARNVKINNTKRYTIALGLVITGLSQRLLANFYFKIKKVDYPVKTFKSEEEATQWLTLQIALSKKAG